MHIAGLAFGEKIHTGIIAIIHIVLVHVAKGAVVAGRFHAGIAPGILSHLIWGVVNAIRVGAGIAVAPHMPQAKPVAHFVGGGAAHVIISVKGIGWLRTHRFVVEHYAVEIGPRAWR